MKKTNTSNPLKFFNDAKAARNKSFSKFLIKADNGRTMGPMTQQEAAAEATATSYPGPYAIPRPTWSSQAKELASKAVSELARPTDMLGTNVERSNAILRDPARGVANSLSKAQQLEMINREEINRMNTTPKTGIPANNEELNYIKLRQEAINKGAKNGGMMKKGGTHKMPNGKVMLNSAMKKKTSKKK
jgi:hypothetical protein